jgi:hypothetical protein
MRAARARARTPWQSVGAAASPPRPPRRTAQARRPRRGRDGVAAPLPWGRLRVWPPGARRSARRAAAARARRAGAAADGAPAPPADRRTPPARVPPSRTLSEGRPWRRQRGRGRSTAGGRVGRFGVAQNPAGFICGRWAYRRSIEPVLMPRGASSARNRRPAGSAPPPGLRSRRGAHAPDERPPRRLPNLPLRAQTRRRSQAPDRGQKQSITPQPPSPSTCVVRPGGGARPGRVLRRAAPRRGARRSTPQHAAATSRRPPAAARRRAPLGAAEVPAGPPIGARRARRGGVAAQAPSLPACPARPRPPPS